MTKSQIGICVQKEISTSNHLPILINQMAALDLRYLSTLLCISMQPTLSLPYLQPRWRKKNCDKSFVIENLMSAVAPYSSFPTPTPPSQLKGTKYIMTLGLRLHVTNRGQFISKSLFLRLY